MYTEKKEENERTLKTERIIYMFISKDCLITYGDDRPKIFYNKKKKKNKDLQKIDEDQNCACLLK